MCRLPVDETLRCEAPASLKGPNLRSSSGAATLRSKNEPPPARIGASATGDRFQKSDKLREPKPQARHPQSVRTPCVPPVRLQCPRMRAIRRPKRPAALCSSCAPDAGVPGFPGGIGALSSSRPCLMSSTRRSVTWHSGHMKVWCSTPGTSSWATFVRINSPPHAVQRIDHAQVATAEHPLRVR